MSGLARIGAVLAAVWTRHQDLITLVGGGLLALYLLWLLRKAINSPQKSRLLATITGLVVAGWTSFGIWHVAAEMRIPTGLRIVTFFVFEALFVTCATRAEEHRKTKGVPGPAGTLLWIIGLTMGGVAALGENLPVGWAVRICVPLLAISVYWVTLTAERDDDTDEMKAERVRLAEQRSATWVWTWREILVRLGLMKPGATTITEAQRDRQINRMVVFADRVALCRWQWRRDRASRHLRRLTRSASDEMVAEVARRQEQAAHAVVRMVTVGPQPAETDAARRVLETLSFPRFASPWRRSAIMIEAIQVLRAQAAEDLRVQSDRADAAQLATDAAQAEARRLAAQVDDLSAQVQRAGDEHAETLRAAQVERDRHAEEMDSARTDLRRAAQAASKPGEQRKAPAQVTELHTDKAIADRLAQAYRDKLAQDGEPLTRYRVEVDGQCKSTQAVRVLAILARRYPTQAAQNAAEPAAPSARAGHAEDSDDDQEHVS